MQKKTGTHSHTTTSSKEQFSAEDLVHCADKLLKHLKSNFTGSSIIRHPDTFFSSSSLFQDKVMSKTSRTYSIPSFSTLEELKMKLAIAGTTAA